MAALAKGDTIGIASTGSPVEPQTFDQGIAALKECGFDAVWSLDPIANYDSTVGGFCTASAQERAEALHALFADDSVGAIIAGRGGYGSAELLGLLDYEFIKQHPKPFVGYSDVTVLLLALWANAGISSIHGPTIGCEFSSMTESQDSAKSVHALLAMLVNPEFRVHASGRCLRRGAGEGPVIAGNLTMLLSMLGTPWDLSYDGSVLVVEDVGEAPYRIHRALVQLKQAGKLENLSAMVFGRFSCCESNSGLSTADVLERCVDDIFNGTSYPILLDVDVGHNGCNLPLPIGCRTLVEPDGLQTLESPIAAAGV